MSISYPQVALLTSGVGFLGCAAGYKLSACFKDGKKEAPANNRHIGEIASIYLARIASTFAVIGMTAGGAMMGYSLAGISVAASGLELSANKIASIKFFISVVSSSLYCILSLKCIKGIQNRI